MRELSAEIIFYGDEVGGQFTLSLDPIEIRLIQKVLNLKLTKEEGNEYYYKQRWDDETLESIYKNLDTITPRPKSKKNIE